MVSAKNHLPEQVLYINPPSMRNHYFFLKKKTTVIRSWFVSYRETTKRLFHKNLYKFFFNFSPEYFIVYLIFHWSLTAPSFYLLLDLGGEKESLPESRQAFEFTEARTSGLLNLVFFMSSNWFFEREHPFIIIDKSMVITELAVSRKLRWCRDLLAAMHMLKKIC